MHVTAADVTVLCKTEACILFDIWTSFFRWLSSRCRQTFPEQSTVTFGPTPTTTVVWTVRIPG